MEPGEDDLAAEPVVVANAITRDRESEQAVEQDRQTNEAREVNALRLELRGFTVGGEVAAKFFERVHPERHALLDHERVEREVAVTVCAVVNQIPEHE